ncbi:hypothetical protein FPSE_02813 [Fusarium pseudograminearum CS3096]|uniref:CBM-cenC domain-containing protein n=1 Tax=Fusarium pseudograminearum (strain CS3096) TaxID=1028729 RepID=K3VSD6_FUSPC|nr:hypothetical protein FPSE_02813 [Fusarium pseudograminearum CS3096]EKJ76938.1 hypothetical protein FPSE_02813 [Fusarium pseudograminearum CS3096]
MRLVSLITVLGAALIPAASARPANCRPQRPTTTSGVSTSITTSVVGAETSSTDAASATLTTSSEAPNVIETTETESLTATSDMTRAVSESSSVTTAVETTITESETTTLITTATTTTETSPTEVSTTESTSPDQTSSAVITTIAVTTFETTTSDTTTSSGMTTGEQTTVQTTTAETTATTGTTSAETITTKQTTGLTTSSETTTAAESTTTTEIPTTTTAAPEPTKALQNGGFEDAMDNAWTFQSGEITTDPSLAHSGSNFAKIDIRNEQAGGQQHIEQITSSSNTKQYTLSFYATFLSTPNMELGNGCYVYALQDSSSINAPTFYLNVDTLNSYQHFTYTFTPYNNNFLLSLRVRCSRGMATTFSVAIDDVSIVEVV